MRSIVRSLVLVAMAAALVAAAASASAQQSTPSPDPSGAQSSPIVPGWSLTPGVMLSRVYDDNVLLRGPGDPQTPDYITMLNPRGDLSYNGPRSTVSMQYDGDFILYRELNSLNSYDQHGGITVKRKLSKHQSFFLSGSATAAPTTELLQLAGVPYVRAGVFTDTIRAGLENTLTKRLSIVVEGHFEQAKFDESQAFANLLLGGNSYGADVSVRHRLSEYTSLIADADIQHATIGLADEQFDIQHAIVGLERQLTEGFRVFASGGISRVGASQFGPSRSDPSWRLGLAEHYRSTSIDVSFNRSYIPSFGFGGTMQSEDVTARVQMPITRRIYTQELVSWSRQDPLVIEVPSLRSTWMQAAVGYATRPWLRIEAYFAGTRQTAGRVDGALLAHNQFGVQLVAAKPMRVR